MFDRLLLKIIGARLVEPGSCPYNQHCIHAGHNGCLATKEELKRREAAIKAEAEKEDYGSVVYALMDYSEKWPCSKAQIYVIILPPELQEGDNEKCLNDSY
jgi:hypothetical protein